MNDAVTLALIAIVGTVITALFKLLADNTKALTKLAEASETGNREAKERNGHLGEQNIQIAQLVTRQGGELSHIKETNQSIERILVAAAETLSHTEADKAKAIAGVRDDLRAK